MQFATEKRPIKTTVIMNVGRRNTCRNISYFRRFQFSRVSFKVWFCYSPQHGRHRRSVLYPSDDVHTRRQDESFRVVSEAMEYVTTKGVDVIRQFSQNKRPPSEPVRAFPCLSCEPIRLVKF